MEPIIIIIICIKITLLINSREKWALTWGSVLCFFVVVIFVVVVVFLSIDYGFGVFSMSIQSLNVNSLGILWTLCVCIVVSSSSIFCSF